MPADPVPPDFVANFPKLHAERRRMSVRGAHRTILRSRWSVAVFDPGGGLFNSPAASFHLDGNCRLRPDGTREKDELVCTEVARFGLILPGKISPRGSLVAWSGAPKPVVILRDVAARPANEGGFEGLDFFKHITADTSRHGIAGQQRYLIHPQAASSRKKNRESSEWFATSRLQDEFIFTPITANDIDLSSRVDVALLDV